MPVRRLGKSATPEMRALQRLDRAVIRSSAPPEGYFRGPGGWLPLPRPAQQPGQPPPDPFSAQALARGIDPSAIRINRGRRYFAFNPAPKIVSAAAATQSLIDGSIPIWKISIDNAASSMVYLALSILASNTSWSYRIGSQNSAEIILGDNESNTYYDGPVSAVWESGFVAGEFASVTIWAAA